MLLVVMFLSSCTRITSYNVCYTKLLRIKYSDKAFMGSVMSGANAEDSVKMVEILFGAEAIRENPALVV